MVNVSIIIPVYNVEQYIESCLYSVINQTYKGTLECIIVNDCTPDQSMEVVNRLLSVYQGNILFKIINHQENKGLSAARNSGVKIAKGDYLYFLDSDDILVENAIELLSNLSLQSFPDVIMGDFDLIGDNQYIPRLNTSVAIFDKQKEIFNAFISYSLYEMAWNKLVKKSFFLKYDLWFREGIIHEDSLWSFNLFYYCNNLRVCFQRTYLYRVRENSIMTDPKNIIKSFNSYCEIFFLKINFIKEKRLFYEFPLLVKYMVDAKFLLEKIVIEQNLDKETYTRLKNQLGICYILEKDLTIITRLKLLLSNLPFKVFKLMLFYFFKKIMKVSIIVPVYKSEPFLEDCINSIINQIFTDWELILVDDGSPDFCGRICDSFAVKDSRIKVLHQKNSGVSVARNRGIYQAKGEYICFVDSDDLIEPDFLNSFWIIIEHHIQFDSSLSFGEDHVFSLQFLLYVQTLSFIQNSGYLYVKRKQESLTSAFIPHSMFIRYVRLSYNLRIQNCEKHEIAEKHFMTFIEVEKNVYVLRAILSLFSDKKLSHKKRNELLFFYLNELNSSVAISFMPGPYKIVLAICELSPVFFLISFLRFYLIINELRLYIRKILQ